VYHRSPCKFRRWIAAKLLHGYLKSALAELSQPGLAIVDYFMAYLLHQDLYALYAL
jgi:hypothetical protein